MPLWHHVRAKTGETREHGEVRRNKHASTRLEIHQIDAPNSYVKCNCQKCQIKKPPQGTSLPAPGCNAEPQQLQPSTLQGLLLLGPRRVREQPQGGPLLGMPDRGLGCSVWKSSESTPAHRAPIQRVSIGAREEIKEEAHK